MRPSKIERQESKEEERTGMDRSGQDSRKEEKTGMDRSGQVSAGQESIGKHSLAQDRIRSVRTGKDRTV